MRVSWHEIWGCARGPVLGTTPQTRMMAGALVFAGCMVAPPATLPGFLVTATGTAAWLVGCQPPARLLRNTSLLGLALFLPYILLLPLLEPGDGSAGWSPLLAVPWRILVRGMSGLLVSIATVSCLSASDLREGLLRLPVPGMVSAILVQIVHQTATLLYETRRVAAAMAVRGASRGGLAAWKVLTSLPKVWLPRIIVRAERVAAAMEIRGYADSGLRSFKGSAMRLSDAVTLALALVVLGFAVTIRLWSGT